MAYQYRGTRTDDGVPLAPVLSVPSRPEPEYRNGAPYYPRPDVEQIPGAIWHARYGEWEARFKFRGQTIRVGRFRLQEDALEAVEERRRLLWSQTPDWREPCGTPAAYARHARNGEPVDAECRRAIRNYDAARRRARKEAA